MKLQRILSFLLAILALAPTLHAQSPTLSTQPGLFLAPSMAGQSLDQGFDLLGDRKKRKKKKKFLEARHKTLAVGLVGGDPLGLGVRGVLRFGQFGVSADAAWNRLRNDNGLVVDALGMKTDFRLYSKGFLAKVVRPYTFVGLTTHRGPFNETDSQTAVMIDGGFGAGVKLFRLEIGAEAGVLIPARQLDLYRPGVGAFLNANVLLWLF